MKTAGGCRSRWVKDGISTLLVSPLGYAGVTPALQGDLNADGFVTASNTQPLHLGWELSAPASGVNWWRFHVPVQEMREILACSCTVRGGWGERRAWIVLRKNEWIRPEMLCCLVHFWMLFGAHPGMDFIWQERGAVNNSAVCSSQLRCPDVDSETSRPVLVGSTAVTQNPSARALCVWVSAFEVGISRRAPALLKHEVNVSKEEAGGSRFPHP